MLAAFLPFYFAVIVAMVFHEAAHALVAYIGGDRTAYEAGQVTLNPIPHMRRAPFGMIGLPIISFYFLGFPMGFAHAPYNPYWADRYPKRAAVMSLAGPAANLILCVVVFAIFKIGFSQGIFERPIPVARMTIEELFGRVLVGRDDLGTDFLGATAKILSYIFSMNLILGLFNLLPVPPLDGAGVAEGLLPNPLGGFFRWLRTEQIYSWIGLMLAMWLCGEYLLDILIWARNLVQY